MSDKAKRTAEIPAQWQCRWCGSETGCDCDDRMACKQAGACGHKYCGMRPCGCPTFAMCDCPKRTAGPLRVSAGHPWNLMSDDGIVGATNNYSSPTNCRAIGQANANARHLAACWNAVESIGGDPATVEELVATLRWYVDFESDAEACGDFTSGSPRAKTLACARAVLARVKGGGK